MKPIPAAIQLTKVWRTICPDGQPYPVDCRLLAEALNVKVHGEQIDDRFEAALRIRGKTRVIIYNENIREDGRKNFCISHELGHNSCHAKKDEYFCTTADLFDTAPHPENVEQEANQFAANLLMPADDFRAQMAGMETTLANVSVLANDRYDASLTAACIRMLDLSPRRALGIAVLRGNTVVRWKKTEEMRWTGFGFRRGHNIPIAGLTHNPEGEEIESEVWLSEKNAPRWNLRQSTVHMPYYGETLALIVAERAEEYDELEEPDPTPPRMPSFRR